MRHGESSYEEKILEELGEPGSTVEHIVTFNNPADDFLASVSVPHNNKINPASMPATCSFSSFADVKIAGWYENNGSDFDVYNDAVTEDIILVADIIACGIFTEDPEVAFSKDKEYYQCNNESLINSNENNANIIWNRQNHKVSLKNLNIQHSTPINNHTTGFSLYSFSQRETEVELIGDNRIEFKIDSTTHDRVIAGLALMGTLKFTGTGSLDIRINAEDGCTDCLISSIVAAGIIKVEDGCSIYATCGGNTYNYACMALSEDSISCHITGSVLFNDDNPLDTLDCLLTTPGAFTFYAYYVNGDISKKALTIKLGNGTKTDQTSNITRKVTRSSSSRSRTTRFGTGTWDCPTIGDWTQNNDGTWSFGNMAFAKFTNTWGYICDPYSKTRPADWYYFDEKGCMLTGLQEINGKKYYFNEVHDGFYGAMASGWQTINGKKCYFSEERNSSGGELIETKEQ